MSKFFEKLTEKMEGYNFHLFVKKKGEVISIILSPEVESRDKNYFPPFTISGHASTIDEQLIEQLPEVVALTSSTVSNIGKFKDEMAALEKEKTTSKTKSSSDKSKPKPKKKELTPEERMNKFLDQAKSYFERKRFKQAIKSFDEALKFAKGKKKDEIKSLQMDAKVKLRAAQEDCSYNENDDIPDVIVESTESEENADDEVETDSEESDTEESEDSEDENEEDLNDEN